MQDVICAANACTRPAAAGKGGLCGPCAHLARVAKLPPCLIEGCGKSGFCRGWCTAHYSRWQRHRDPLYQERSSPRGPEDFRQAEALRAMSRNQARRPVRPERYSTGRQGPVLLRLQLGCRAGSQRNEPRPRADAPRVLTAPAEPDPWQPIQSDRAGPAADRRSIRRALCVLRAAVEAV